MSEEEYDDEELIKYTGNYGGITCTSKFWDDLEEMGEEVLLQIRIEKVKIYSGKYQGKDAIFGVGITFKNFYTGETRSYEHIGSEQFDTVKEFDVQDDEHVVDFHIRFPLAAEYISQIGFSTDKGNKILVGTEDEEEKNVLSHNEDNIIVGTFGAFDKKIDAMGVLYINKRVYFQKIFPKRYFPLYMLRYLVETDKVFKKETEKNYDKLPDEFKYLWKTVNLPDRTFKQIAKYKNISPI